MAVKLNMMSIYNTADEMQYTTRMEAEIHDEWLQYILNKPMTIITVNEAEKEYKEKYKHPVIFIDDTEQDYFNLLEERYGNGPGKPIYHKFKQSKVTLNELYNKSKSFDLPVKEVTICYRSHDGKLRAPACSGYRLTSSLGFIIQSIIKHKKKAVISALTPPGRSANIEVGKYD